ncbi:hypothetical protein P175DRAFT_0547899, partial [Aspergillus ochraceoroseus IBT 24754]
FPGTTVSLSCKDFQNPNFQGCLASFLEKASVESLGKFAAKTRKAGIEISEDRNTANPALITQFLMTLLEMNGKRVNLPVLRKHVKDDACWDKSRLPWRRSPL